MPIYEYECESCGCQFEKIQKMSDDPLKDCPECNESALRKLVSAAAFKLKGTGWYETDFKDNSKNKEDSKKSSTKEKPDSKKSDGKGAKKADKKETSPKAG